MNAGDVALLSFGAVNAIAAGMNLWIYNADRRWYSWIYTFNGYGCGRKYFDF